MKENKDEQFDLDEYIKQMEEEDKKLIEEVKSFTPVKPFELSEEDKRILALEKQIYNERKKESDYVDTLSPEERQDYSRKKYEIVEELARLNKVKIAKLKPKDKKE